MFDVVTLGETMIRLTPPDKDLLEYTSTLQVHVGGSESNMAVGLARLGVSVAWVSRLTRHPLNNLIVNTLRGQRVNVDHVIWTDSDRVPTYYLEESAPPRSSRVFYDRAYSAMAHMTPDDFPSHLISRDKTRLLHLSGITLALSQTALETCSKVVDWASEIGLPISFDTNYRARLWSPEKAYETCMSFMNSAALLFVPRGDAEQLFEISPSASHDEALRVLHEAFPAAMIVMTVGEDGAVAVRPEGDIHRQPAFAASEFSRLGRGDAFSAGFLSVYVRTDPNTLLTDPYAFDLDYALRKGNAAAALKSTIAGDMPLIDPEAVEALLNADSPRLIR